MNFYYLRPAKHPQYCCGFSHSAKGNWPSEVATGLFEEVEGPVPPENEHVTSDWYIYDSGLVDVGQLTATGLIDYKEAREREYGKHLERSEDAPCLKVEDQQDEILKHLANKQMLSGKRVQALEAQKAALEALETPTVEQLRQALIANIDEDIRISKLHNTTNGVDRLYNFKVGIKNRIPKPEVK